MKLEPVNELDRFRKVHPILGGSDEGALWGYFEIPVGGEKLHVISSGSGDEWEHVSVSLPKRCPTWDEMCYVKNLFWNTSETVVQFHPKQSKYVNKMEFCLHLWRNRSGHKLPPGNLVG